MPNIHRRKIYETMLIFEDGMIDLNIILINQDNFEKFKDKFISRKLEEMKKSFQIINALIIMFLENKQYQTEKEFEDELNYLKSNKNEIHKIIKKDKNLFHKFKDNIFELETYFLPINNINSIQEGKILFEKLDIYNSYVPKILEFRRDQMK